MMNINQKTSKPGTSLSPLQPLSNYSLDADNKNNEKIEWEKIDDKIQNENNKQGTDNLSRNTLQSPTTRSATLHFQGISVTLTLSSALSRHKPGILGDLIEGLKEFSIVKNKRKEFYNAAI